MDQRDERIEKNDREILRKYDVRSVVRITAPKILLFLCGYFASLGELPFGARPFGVALLAQLGFGKLSNPQNLKKQVEDDSNK